MHVCRCSYHKQPLMSVGESKWTGEGMGQGHYCKQAPPEGVSADPLLFLSLGAGSEMHLCVTVWRCQLVSGRCAFRVGIRSVDRLMAAMQHSSRHTCIHSVAHCQQ